MQNLQQTDRNFDTSKFTRGEAAKYLGISLVSVDRAISKKRIAHYRVGRRVIFGKHHLDEFLSQNEVKAKSLRRNSEYGS